MLKDDKKESEVRYKNPTEYAKYIRRTYDCMKENAYQIVISERLYYRATKDKKIEQWLEDNLSQLPYCMDSLSSIIAVTGGHLVSCICHMNNDPQIDIWDTNRNAIHIPLITSIT